MSNGELAQKILDWITRTREEMESVSETYAQDMQAVLIDDIEELCRKEVESKR